MDYLEFESTQAHYISMINNALLQLFPEENAPYQKTIRAMRYSLLSGGKRIRPILLLEFNRICGGNTDVALAFACAIEMIHTFSLIHDDLPCMDNDILRRGKPTCHVAFGEATALLAGDALLCQAFELTSKAALQCKLPAETIVRCMAELSSATGCHGMIGGQTMDIEIEEGTATEAQLKMLQRLKTGALISTACKIGCILAGSSEEMLHAAEQYADCIGLAFQIQDDILDLTSSAEEMGKSVRKDILQKKATFPSMLGIDNSKLLLDKLTDSALAQIACLPDCEFLKLLTLKLKERKN